MSRTELGDFDLFGDGLLGDISDRGQGLLAAAADPLGQLAIRRYLSEGVPVDSVDKNSHTPLMVACLKGHKGNMKILLEAGADAGHKSKQGKTPLMAACLNVGNLGVVVPIIQVIYEKADSANAALADINATDHRNRTALHYACLCGHDRIIKALIDSRADPMIPSIVSGNSLDVVTHIADEEKRKLCTDALVRATAVTQRMSGKNWNYLSSYISSSPEITERVLGLLNDDTKTLLAVILPEGSLRNKILEGFAANEDELEKIDYLRVWKADLSRLNLADQNRAVALKLGFGNEFPLLERDLSNVCSEEEMKSIAEPVVIVSRQDILDALALFNEDHTETRSAPIIKSFSAQNVAGSNAKRQKIGKK